MYFAQYGTILVLDSLAFMERVMHLYVSTRKFMMRNNNISYIVVTTANTAADVESHKQHATTEHDTPSSDATKT